MDVGDAERAVADVERAARHAPAVLTECAAFLAGEDLHLVDRVEFKPRVRSVGVCGRFDLRRDGAREEGFQAPDPLLYAVDAGFGLSAVAFSHFNHPP